MRNGHVFNIIVSLLLISNMAMASSYDPQSPSFPFTSGAKALGDILARFGRHDGEKSLQDGGRVGACRLAQF